MVRGMQLCYGMLHAARVYMIVVSLLAAMQHRQGAAQVSEWSRARQGRQRRRRHAAGGEQRAA